MTRPPLHHLFHPDHVEEYLATLGTGLDQLAGQLTTVRGPSTGLPPELAAKLVDEVDLDQPLGDTRTALEELRRVYLDDTVWFHEPGYAAHLNCPVLIPALLAELFVSGVNTSVDTFDQSVGATYIERRLIDWTAERIGFPAGDGVFTSGGTQSNLQALHLARDRALAAGHRLAELRVFVSADGHFSVQKAARILGLDESAVVAVPVTTERRMDPRALERALRTVVADGGHPMAVVATAGTTDFGAIDPLPAVAATARQYGAWLHVDAAYGGGLLVSRQHRGLLAGIEAADSVTVDYHKTWFLPVSASALVVRDPDSLRHVTWHADYLNPRGSTQPNQVDKSLQTTRRFDALKLWLTLRTAGAEVIGGYVDRVLALAADVADHLVALPDVELHTRPHLSTLVFRYRPRQLPEATADVVNRRARELLYEGGTAMVAATTVDDRTWLKFTLLNPIAETADILRIVDELRVLGATVAATVEEAAG